MKHHLILSLTALLMVLSTLEQTAWAADLYWYLASSMVKPGKEVAKRFNAEHSNVHVVVVSGGSGQLLSKIVASKKGDLYTPAAADYIAQVQQLGLLEKYQPFIEQRLVFALSKSGQKKIQRFEELHRKGIRIAFGNPKTMALGRLYRRVEEAMGENAAMRLRKNQVVAGLNVSQVINYLQADIVDAGIAFDSAAKANGLAYITLPDSLSLTATAPLIQLKSQRSAVHSRQFIDFLFQSREIFEQYGFHITAEQE